MQILGLFAQRLDTDKEALAFSLTKMTKEYKIINSKKVLVISSIPGSLFKIKNALVDKGFNEDNLFFKDIDEDISSMRVDAVIFNDRHESSIDDALIENFIDRNKKSIEFYFYFGSRQVNLRGWKDRFNVNISAANLFGTLSRNLINLFTE